MKVQFSGVLSLFRSPWREPCAPPHHTHGDLTSLAPHERLPEILVVPRVSDFVRPHRWQPTRLPRPWDSPGKNVSREVLGSVLNCETVPDSFHASAKSPSHAGFPRGYLTSLLARAGQRKGANGKDWGDWWICCSWFRW